MPLWFQNNWNVSSNCPDSIFPCCPDHFLAQSALSTSRITGTGAALQVCKALDAILTLARFHLAKKLRCEFLDTAEHLNLQELKELKPKALARSMVSCHSSSLVRLPTISPCSQISSPTQFTHCPASKPWSEAIADTAALHAPDCSTFGYWEIQWNSNVSWYVYIYTHRMQKGVSFQRHQQKRRKLQHFGKTVLVSSHSLNCRTYAVIVPS